MQFDPSRHGEQSRTQGAPALRDAWARADQMTAQDGGTEWRWIPWETVWLKPGIGPRDVDHDTVERYAESFEELPPITVQARTFALVDGRHRLEAAARAGSDFIKARFADIPDDELALRAFEANLNHGLPYRTSERIKGLKLMLQHYPEMSNGQLVRRLGLSYETVAKYRAQIEGAADVTTRVGADGKRYKVPNQSSSAISQVSDQVSENRRPGPVSSFDPGPDLQVSDQVSENRRPGPVSSFDPGPDPEQDHDIPFYEPGDGDEVDDEDPFEAHRVPSSRWRTAEEPAPAPVAREDATEKPDGRFRDTFSFVRDGAAVRVEVALLVRTQSAEYALIEGCTEASYWLEELSTQVSRG